MKKLETITILRVIGILLLLWALADNPYGYYQILRWAICGVSAYSAYLAYKNKKNAWVWVFGILAVLYNPIEPIHLNKAVWSFFNIVSAWIIFASVFKMKADEKSKSKKTTTKKDTSRFVMVGVTFLIILTAGYLFLIGINSKTVIKNPVKKSLQYRIVGDCDSFVDYIYNDIEKSRERCEEEKMQGSRPIRKFNIKNISHKFGSDQAFLTVELTRLAKDSKNHYSYVTRYEVKRDGFSWKIYYPTKK